MWRIVWDFCWNRYFLAFYLNGFVSLICWNIHMYMIYVDDICMQHLQSFFCKHQSCAKLSNLSSSNLNSSCWIEILVEQMVFLEAKNTSADRCFRRKLKLNFLGGSSFRGFWSWLWLFLLYSTCCKCCLFPKKKYYRL